MVIFRPMIFNTQAQLWTTYLKGRDSKRGKTTSSKEPMKTTKRNMELSHGQMKMEKMNILEVSIKMENFMEKENSSKKESDYTRESLKMERSTDKGSSSKTMEWPMWENIKMEWGREKAKLLTETSQFRTMGNGRMDFPMAKGWLSINTVRWKKENGLMELIKAVFDLSDICIEQVSFQMNSQWRLKYHQAFHREYCWVMRWKVQNCMESDQKHS